MKTIYYTAVSLDGYIADEQHSLDWLLQFGEPEAGYFARFMAEVGCVAMGSTTYEWLLRQPAPDGADGPAWPYTQPAWVFSFRQLTAVPGADIHFARGDVRPAHREMVAAANGKNVWILGGGDLAGQFYDAGLLDEIMVSVTAVTLGGGAPLLPRAIIKPSLRLLSARQYGETFVDLRYQVVR